MISYFIAPGLKDMQLKAFLRNSKISDEDRVAKVIAVVSKQTGIEESELKGRTRKGEISIARQICMYFVKKKTLKSLKEIGLLFNRDHSTAIHNIRVIENMIDIDKRFKSFILTIEKELE